MPLSSKEKKLLENYLIEHKEQYSKDTLEYLMKHYDTDIDEVVRPLIITQIYSHLKILPKKKDLYYYLYQVLSKHHDINSNILEIGGGHFPAFAKLISKKQYTDKKGSITVYAPKLVIKKFQQIRLIKESFTKEKNISSFDLITAVMPCEATELVIKQANKYHKELFLVLCGCIHFDYNDDYYDYFTPTLKDWENYIKTLIKQDPDFEIKEERIPEEFGINYLILSKKLKK